MKTYEKPIAELVKFESENILLDIPEIGGEFSVGEGVEDWD